MVMGAAVGVPDSPPASKLPPGAYYALTVLTALNVINVWHRYLVANLVAVSVEDCDVCDDVSFVPLCYMDDELASSEADCLSCRYSYSTEFYNLKDGACIDNSQYSILAGVCFTIPFAIATLFAGRLTDTLNRRLLHTGAILVWSLAAAAHGVCEDFSCLMVSQIVLGIGEAFNAPACYAMITLYFPHSKRATANGIYSSGTYLGSAMSSLCLALAVLLGWRNTAFLAGAFGVLAGAVLFFTVEHNPVMPPSNDGYTKLPDDDDDVGDGLAEEPSSLLPPPPSHEKCTKLEPLPPLAAMAGVGHRKVVSVGDSNGNRGGAGGARASYGGCVGGETRAADPAVSNGDDRRELAAAAAEAGRRESWSSASSTSSTSSYEYAGSGAVGGGGGPASAGGAVGSSGSGGDIAPVRWVATRESPIQAAGGGRRTTRANVSGRNPFAKSGNPFAVRPSTAEGQERDGGAGRWVDGDGAAGCEEDRGARGGRGRGNGSGRGRGGSGGAGRYQPIAAGGAGASDAPYSAALVAVGAGSNDPNNGSGWGWYDEEDHAAAAGAGAGAGAAATPAGGGGRWKDVEGSGPQRGGGGGGGGEGGGGGLGKHDLGQALRMIVSNRVVLVLFAASSARMIGTWASAGYMAVYYHRQYPSQVALYSVINAGFVSVGGMASSYGGGAISDRLRVRNEGVLGYIPALGSLAAIGPIAVVLFAKDFYVSVGALFVSYLVGECWLGPGMACLQMELPKELAGTSVAILLFLNSVICNIGTWFIGKMDTGLATVRKPFFAVLFMSYVTSFVLFGVLGLMVSRKHQRRNSCLLSLRAAGILEEETGPGCGGSSSAKEYASGGNGRAATSMCEMVRRTFSRAAGGVGESLDGPPSSDRFGEFGGLAGGRGQEAVDGYSDLEFHVPGQRYAAAAAAGVGGSGGHAPARRPAVTRGRSVTRGDTGIGGGRSRGAAAAGAAGVGAASVSSTKMR